MRLLLLLLVATLGACATTSTPAPPAAGKAVEYVPLAVGNRWSYRVVPGPEQPQELRIVELGKDGYFVDSAGGRFAPRGDGVFDGQRFVLQDPLVVDHTWFARPKQEKPEHYRIVATDAAVTVPAGTFSTCVQVQGEQIRSDPESGREVKVLIAWTYAKDVGLIKIQQRVQRGNEDPLTTATMELVSYSLEPKKPS